MDQSYLEWLAGLPFLDEAKARALADRFPTFEHLRAASRDELLSVAGVRPEDVEALHGLVHAEADGATKGAELFLCPACGSFAGSSATVCPVCGASFVEAASEPPSPAPTPQAPEIAPERSYVEWLEGLPRLGTDKALRIVARFPTFEHLRTATSEELRAVEGLTDDDLAALRTLLGDTAGRDASGRLFLCPECGSFLGTVASACPVCGASITEEGLSRPIRAPSEEVVADGLPLLCLHCGAFMSPKQARCGMCGRGRAPGEIALLPGVDVSDETKVPFCPHCGAYLYAESDECIICGRAVDEAKAATNGQSKGVGRSFLSRWKRIAEAGTSTDEDRLRDELEHYERLLEADPLLERAWAKRGRVLADLGRTREAAESLVRASELNPSKDDAYRIEVLNLLRSEGDVSFLPVRWRPPAATAGPPARQDRLLETLRHYDDLLRADPTLAMAWRTKGEILGRLGRDEEARDSLARASMLEGREDVLRRSALGGIQAQSRASRAMTRPTGRVNGRVNGFTNGRVNGLTNGRVNGLTNGRVNGLGSWTGATNGLVNGDGFTNGRRGRYGPPRVMPQQHWARSLTGVAAVVALMVLVPLLASLILPVPGPVDAIRIDHDFADWVGIQAYVDSATDQVENPGANLIETKMVVTQDDIFAYARLQGSPFSAPDPDIVYVFVDEDGDPTTGYPIGDLGADGVAEVYGWDGRIRVATRYAFNGTIGSVDWNHFVPRGRAMADSLGTEIEIQMSSERGKQDARVLVYAADGLGHRDPADGAVKPDRPAFYVVQETVAAEVLSTGRAPILRVALVPIGGVPLVSALNFTQAGTSTDPVSLTVYEDDGSGALDAPDTLLSSASVAARRATLSIGRSLLGPLVLWVEASWTTMAPASTFGLRVADVWTPDSASLRSPEVGLSYLVAAPSFLRVDGAFGDWTGRMYGQDLLGDVLNRTSSAVYNANVDILATAVDIGSNVTAFVRVDGRILGGEDIPTIRARTADNPALDSDADGVPDIVEISLPNPDLMRDFNNDNVTDNRTGGDVDADGLVDHPEGPDVWLNTTIPLWYPTPYAGRATTRYIGPITPQVVEGLDVVYAYLDADNRSDTGLSTIVSGNVYGFEYAFAILGRNGVIRSSGLFGYVPGGNPWTYLAAVDAGLDAHRIEFAVNASLLGVSSGYRMIFLASDWRLDFDEADPRTSVTSFPVGAQAATSVVINEISPAPNPEWIELANPTSTAVSLAGWDLVRVSGNKIVVLYTFTTQVLGAWGSGTEYLAVALPNNSLPNGNIRVRLRQSGTPVDETAYSVGVGGGRSWSRLKDPLTGVPLDTGTDAADFYISLAPSRGQGNDRHRPTIAVAKTTSAAAASPGDTITYTVYYNNTDTGLSRTVWVNDTLPSGITFVSSSIAPTTATGPTYGWVFTNVLPTSGNSFTITVMVNANGADGSVQANAVTLDYTDQLQRRLPRTQAWANVTVVRPMIQVAKTVSPSTAQVGETVTFTIYYNNTGSVAAGTVSIKDVLPVGLNYTGSSPAPSWTDGRTFFWNFTNVAPGTHSLSLTAIVTAAANGTSLVNWAFLNYTTVGGFPLQPSSASTVLAVPEFHDVVLVLALPVLLLGLRHRRRAIKRGSG